MQSPMLPRSERQRALQALSFAENSILTRDLPKDTVLKHLQLRLSGSVVTTFASGTPVADAFSTFDNVIPRIDVIVNGSRAVKSVRPYMLQMQQMLSTLIRGERKASAGAAAATGNNPTADGGFVYGTTGQISTVAETVLVSFENVYAQQGRESTWLNLRGVASAELRLTTSAFSKLLGFGNTAPVVYSSSTMQVDIKTVEAQDVPAEVVFSDWKQTTKEVTFSAETVDFAIDINRGNKLQGLMFLARDGAAGSTTTATGKLANNLAMRKMALVVNGQSYIKATTFQELQAENRIRYGIDAKYSSNVSAFDGVARMDLLSRGDLNTALDVRPPLVDNCQLLVTSSNSSDVSYTNPVSLTIMTEEIVSPR